MNAQVLQIGEKRASDTQSKNRNLLLCTAEANKRTYEAESRICVLFYYGIKSWWLSMQTNFTRLL